MKRIIVLLCLAAFAVLMSADGPPPAVGGMTPRFQVVSGSVEYEPGDPRPTFIRLDTWTGETWFLNSIPVGAGTSVTQFWQSVPESNSPTIEGIKTRLQSGGGK